jgi:hypothetical protein
VVSLFTGSKFQSTNYIAYMGGKYRWSNVQWCGDVGCVVNYEWEWIIELRK